MCGGIVHNGGVIEIISLDGSPLGTAKIAYCDPQHVGSDPDDVNIVSHDMCVLQVSDPMPPFRRIPGFAISRSLPPNPFQLCHQGILSWESGASGSPFFLSDMTLTGILSAVSNTQAVPVSRWKNALRGIGVTPPARLHLNDPEKNRPVTMASCGTFTPPSIPILTFLGTHSQAEGRDWAAPIPTVWCSVSLPNMRPAYITSPADPLSQDSVSQMPASVTQEGP